MAKRFQVDVRLSGNVLLEMGALETHHHLSGSLYLGSQGKIIRQMAGKWKFATNLDVCQGRLDRLPRGSRNHIERESIAVKALREQSGE
jgi:hypothetical protein